MTKKRVKTQSSTLSPPVINNRKLPIGAVDKRIKISVASTIPTMEAINAKKKRYTAISFFSGIGGSSVGLKWAGFNVLYANEFVPNAAHNYKLNAPDTIVDRRDIRKINAKKLMAKLGLKRGQLDLMDASPPCKVFSPAQARKQGAELGCILPYSEGIKQRVDDLFLEAIRMLRGFMPKTFIMENVEGLSEHVNRGILVEVLDGMENAGYLVEARILDGSRMGIPQKRRRLIFVGIRKDLVRKFGLKPVFPAPTENEAYVSDFLPHIAKVKTAAGFKSSQRAYDAITASDHSIGYTGLFSRGGWVETVKGNHRRFTINELYRMFGFPDDFKLVGSFVQRWERLGRSHAPPMMYAVARLVAKELRKIGDHNE